METPHSQARFTSLAVVVLVITGLVAAGLIPRWRQQAALDSETRAVEVTRVAVVSPTPDTSGLEMILPAQTRPWVEAPIYARASGYLQRWLVDIGMPVKKGELLAVIETPELHQELDQARHLLAGGEAALSLATLTATRYANLVKTASVSEQDNDEKQADLALKTAGVEAERANLCRLESLESFSRVTAPFTGTITARSCEVGELIAAGTGRELFRLSQTNRLRVYVNVPQNSGPRVAPGQRAQVLTGELPGRRFEARVVRTAGKISEDSRTLLTELEVDNMSNEILAGSFEQVRFVVPARQGAFTLPSTTVMFGAMGPHVALVTPEQKIELRNVKLGLTLGVTVQILAGVQPLERIVLDPTEALTTGTSVSVVAAADSGKAARQ